jgi:TetR/AcrR family transcriptional regulator, ethionamide resistance regulator
VGESRAVRQRPRRHTGTSAGELAVFAATERLLATTPLHELNVMEIIRASEISRASFYHYFASKYDVVAALLDQVIEEIYDSTEPWVADDAHQPMLTGLRNSVELWLQHGDVVAAAIENMHAEPHLREVWEALIDTFTQLIAKQIRRERRRKAAPAGAPAETIAAMLVLGTERTLYAAVRGYDPTLVTAEKAFDAISTFWLAAVYGDPHRPGDPA